MAWVSKGNIRGPQGATGNTGAQGPAGSDGAAGEKWFGGTGVPIGTLIGSVVGDWYLNYSNGDVYEKTGSSTWTLRANIKGPTGATGADGAQGIQGPQGNTGATGQAEAWWSGSAAPSSGTGAVGDWYLNTSTGDYYEKTTSTVWTLRGNLTGPQGATGSQGTAGAAGQGVPTGGTVGQILHKDTSTNYDTSWKTVPNDQSAQINPTGTTIASPGRMMGLGVGNQFTPTMTGKVFVTICGTIGNNLANASSAGQLRWGTGTPPANAATPVGTIIGPQIISFGGSLANSCSPFCVCAILSGTVGTALWFDMSLWTSAGATAVLTGVTLSAFEIP